MLLPTTFLYFCIPLFYHFILTSFLYFLPFLCFLFLRSRQALRLDCFLCMPQFFPLWCSCRCPRFLAVCAQLFPFAWRVGAILAGSLSMARWRISLPCDFSADRAQFCVSGGERANGGKDGSGTIYCSSSSVVAGTKATGAFTSKTWLKYLKRLDLCKRYHLLPSSTEDVCLGPVRFFRNGAFHARNSSHIQFCEA